MYVWHENNCDVFIIIVMGMLPLYNRDCVIYLLCYEEFCLSCTFLNQARAGRRPARAWFLEITFMRTSVCVRVCVCVSAPRAIKNYSREMKSE